MTAARRLLVGFVVAMALLALAGTAALADTPLGHSGKVGKHHLVDTSTLPGVVCQFLNTDLSPMTGVNVRAPVIKARDITSGRDHQKVGWQYIIVKGRLNSTKPFVTYFKSPIATATAYDDTPAALDDGATDLLSTPDSRDIFIVKVKMFWYRNGVVEGTATNRFDHYVESAPAVNPEPVPHCTGGYLS